METALDALVSSVPLVSALRARARAMRREVREHFRATYYEGRCVRVAPDVRVWVVRAVGEIEALVVASPCPTVRPGEPDYQMEVRAAAMGDE